MNIWKIATRWSDKGDPNSSIIDIFRKYNILFAGRKQDYIKRSVKPNDIIAISDGITIVSIGKVLDDPRKITDFPLDKIDINSGRFDYEDWVIGFKVSLFDLKKEDWFNYRQGTFHGVNGEYMKKIKSLFEKYNEDYSVNSKFSIDAKTCTLKYNYQNGGDTILNDNTKYVIPIYQRPYSWTEEQIKKFISDIFRSFYGYDKETPPEPMFIGTMQLSAKKYITENKTEQDIIDGQQRLTTFLVLLKQLKNEFPENKELNNISLDWIETRVNNGEQNIFLTEFVKSDLINISEENHNPYIKNAQIVKGLLIDEFTDDENNKIEFDLDGFIKHLLSNIYFVVIETFAGLSKTLQIFDAINTTGLDLNGGDIFKIRMYEYLTDKKDCGESAFDEISKLYAKIDNKNKKENLNISITQILGIYQYIIISKYNLPNVLYAFATTTFFDRLFDTIFNINQWKNFSNSKNIELSLSEIDQIIDVRYQWEEMNYPTVEDACSMNFIWWSRYSRYWILIFVFMYKFKNEDDFEDKLFIFIRQLSKLYNIYSIRYQKAINEIHRFNYSLVDIINTKSVEETIEFINNKIGTSETHNQGWYDLNWFIANNLTHNRKRKDIVCRLSAMLEENYESSNNINEITKKLFDWHNHPIDIEHIQSFNDKNIEERENIKNEWGIELNSLGNLMILESHINRSISNKPYGFKIKKYTDSKYEIVKKQVKDFPEWDLDNAKKRKQKEVEKLYYYLFEIQ
jgi:uncharacterized protein with ParB-like and HNH nuclease domain